jgi:hypothetical protein
MRDPGSMLSPFEETMRVQPQQDGTHSVGRPMIRNSSLDAVGELVVGSRPPIGLGQIEERTSGGVESTGRLVQKCRCGLGTGVSVSGHVKPPDLVAPTPIDPAKTTTEPLC